ncbi:MAG: ubiquinone/menaquinone biosynthesis methyltransferase [Planctomycetaceae bacterium]|jgi:demethylmenaquinone methyltransferase/2-methoxy-6-polyprenyl-1,4-benzoquinol methylase|nr:ubiquinone/menaquinone biosynthesis methyltransferase [Planctomycetaceae bacterium]
MQTQNQKDLDKSPERVKRMFGSIAPCYDFLNHFLSFGVDSSWRRKAVKILVSEFAESGGIGALLDVCCGTGDLIREFVRANKLPCEFCGIDFSDAMIDLARKKLPSISNKLVVGDAMELPFYDGAFGLVSCAFGLRNICNTECGLREMIRVCKSGGVVATLEFAMPQNQLIKYPYKLYFKYILPRIGELLTWNKNGAYNYLHQSVINFDNPKTISEKMQQLGLNEIKIIPMTFGIANLIYGKKIFDKLSNTNSPNNFLAVNRSNILSNKK